MMLHRHFEKEKSEENITTLADLAQEKQDEEFVSEVFPPVEAPKRRGRPKK